MKPVLLAIAGPSRVGKTTILKYIQKKLPYFVRIAQDDMRLFLYRKGFDPESVEPFLYKANPALFIGKQWLEKGYGVMIDANIASRPELVALFERVAKKYDAQFFIIRAQAPVTAVRRRLKKATSELFPNWQKSIAHFERSRKQFDYEKLDRPYVAKVNTARPLASQLRKTISIIMDAVYGK